MVSVLMRKRMKWRKNQKGMTLIELMAVVVILGILAAVAGTAVMGSFSKAKTNADATSHKLVLDAANRYLMDHPATADVTEKSLDIQTDLVTGGYLESVPKNSDGTAYTAKYSFVKNTGVYTVTVTP